MSHEELNPEELEYLGKKVTTTIGKLRGIIETHVTARKLLKRSNSTSEANLEILSRFDEVTKTIEEKIKRRDLLSDNLEKEFFQRSEGDPNPKKLGSCSIIGSSNSRRRKLESKPREAVDAYYFKSHLAALKSAKLKPELRAQAEEYLLSMGERQKDISREKEKLVMNGQVSPLASVFSSPRSSRNIPAPSPQTSKSPNNEDKLKMYLSFTLDKSSLKKSLQALGNDKNGSKSQGNRFEFDHLYKQSVYGGREDRSGGMQKSMWSLKHMRTRGEKFAEIKRNKDAMVPAGHGEASDNSSLFSITEANLQGMYNESHSLQRKLMEGKNELMTQRLRVIMRLDKLTSNIIGVNKRKLLSP
eukprot:TRINITY_DN5851_c0_g1_i1.p1 TRINITY_DN5851_c0_g1~~TRINITY_DN5851_c0_g1_i1.p1  ORF type:complete len:358 (-),score=66.81 TRINITY_DN5851_c0_g1_i1:36-1109(-)